MKKVFYATMLGVLLLGACQYDDSVLTSRVAKLETDMTEVKAALTNVAALQKTVEAVEAGDYIKNVQQVEGGFTVTLAKGGTYTIVNGTNGSNGSNGNDGATPEIKDGYWWINGKNTGVKAEGSNGSNGSNGNDGATPEIKDGYWWINGKNTGVKAVGTDGQTPAAPVVSMKQEDGVWYWTVNNDYPNGQKVRVTAAQPQFRVNEETHNWEVSYDDGATWTVAGPAQTTAGGDQITVAPNEAEGYVDFILLSGASVRVPMEKGFALVIEAPATPVKQDADIEIPYTVKNATQNTVVDAFAGGQFEAAVEEASDKTSGKVLVHTPMSSTGVYRGGILVWADNGAGKTSIKKITMEGQVFEVKAAEEVPAEGGQAEVSVVSNVEFTVSVPEDKPWVKYVETRAPVEKTIVFTVEANPDPTPREAEISILRADDGSLVQSIVLAQKEKELTLVLTKVWGHHGVAGVAGWPAYVSGCEDLDGNFVRNATFDDDFVYVPKTAGIDVNGDGSFDEVKIFKFNVSDGAYAGLVQRTTEPDYMAGTWASTFPVSCTRVMKNTNPALNGGKDILVATNLCDGQNVRTYAWVNGTDQQPLLLTNFGSSRRFGDRITVEGTYQDGYIWYRSFDADGMVAYVRLDPQKGDGAAASHAWTWIEPGVGKAPVGDASNISEYYSFKRGSYGLIATNSSIGLHLVKGAAEMKLYPDLKRCFGWSPFEFNGKNYLAFLSFTGGTNKPVITVLEGASDSSDHLQETLDAYKVVLEASIAGEDPTALDLATTWASSNVGDCQVRIIDGVPYILGAARGGIGLFKMELK